ncbi:endoplasmic oxidoreductin-1 [Polyrhizophydium stewartii]|uniref:Endoplasmic oxidoreductin-1 n=1 Tax=Polyrhizophydium stewartii TaxID=2732419 RepID=A0ABR4NKY2_9FUNG
MSLDSAKPVSQQPLSLAHCSLPSGTVHDTCCRFETAHELNARLLPVLDELVKTTVFRYYKINLAKPCRFWDESMLCTIRDCSVAEASEDEIPIQWRKAALSSIDWVNRKPKDSDALVSQCEFNDKDFCQLDDELTESGRYVNLVENPERFTGYAGESAARVWGAIYNENCFEVPSSHGSMGTSRPLQKAADEVCTEKRVFYNLISGLHSSISIHICDQWLDRNTGNWIANLGCYIERIALHPERLENLYFVWAVTVRAVSKLAPFLRNHPFCEGTGDERLVKAHVDQVAEIVSSCPATFDEKIMFAQAPYQQLKQEFRDHFRNISLIMDCVGCEKCRLWGKLQVTGLGTALKVLFSYGDNPDEYRLTRQELVALMNVFHRLSESLMAVDRFQARIAADLGVERRAAKREDASALPASAVPTPASQAPAADNASSNGGAGQSVSGSTAKPGDATKASAKSDSTGSPAADQDLPLMTAERVLEHMSFFDPKRYVMYAFGIIVTVLGSIRLLQKAYDKNVRAEIDAAKQRSDERHEAQKAAATPDVPSPASSPAASPARKKGKTGRTKKHD